jgi:hypothetical protein
MLMLPLPLPLLLLLVLPCRTNNPWEANLFYIPAMTYAFSSNLGDTTTHARSVIRWVAHTYPWFNRWVCVGGGELLLLEAADSRWQVRQVDASCKQTVSERPTAVLLPVIGAARHNHVTSDFAGTSRHQAAATAAWTMP